MHLIVPFASALAEHGQPVAAGLPMPQLDDLLSRLSETARDSADETTLNPPHERALARALGWPQRADGLLPWAAQAAAQDGIDVGALAWGLLTPMHWRVGSNGVSAADPASLALDEAGSRALFERLAPLFRGEGFEMRYGAPLRWYASHELLRTLPTASPDRVVGRDVNAWLPAPRSAPLLHRLQNEVQMLLHDDPTNEAREARGLLPVNSFWLSGCGVALPAASAGVAVDDSLRSAALAGDGAAWQQAWAALDAGPMARLLEQAQRGEPVRIHLCGERAVVSFQAQPRSLWQRLRGQRVSAQAVLETL